MGNNPLIKALIFFNIVIFLILYAFVTRHIGALFGSEAEQPIGVLLALIPSVLSIIYYMKKK